MRTAAHPMTGDAAATLAAAMPATLPVVVNDAPLGAEATLPCGQVMLRVGKMSMAVWLITHQDELVALEFIEGKDVITLADNLVARLNLSKDQCRAMTDQECRQWQARLQTWQAGERGETGAAPRLRFIGTDFQKRVWRALLGVGWGETISYFDLAKKIASHHRAVAKNGVGRNPIGYFVPCHRVINKNGNLGGYGGGEPIKIKLLAAEGHDFG